MTEDIHNLFGKYFSGQANPQEMREVEQWAEQSEENLSELRLLRELWAATEQTETVRFDTGKAWQKVQSQTYLPQQKKAIVRPMYRAVVAVAASIVLVLGIWWVMKSGNDLETFTATADAQLVSLQDGSTVYLRKGSTLKYPKKFKRDQRHVSLKGEAFFEVAHDPSKPFFIDADKAQVKVVGTSFSVITKNDAVELIVKTGKVRFSAKADSVNALLVVAGEKALYTKDRITKNKNTDPNFNAWQSKKIVFNNIPLYQVVKTLNDYYQADIRINKKDSAAIYKSGVTESFSNQDLASVLKELSLITTYHIEPKGNLQYEISLK
jgi:transmembrane sensor